MNNYFRLFEENFLNPKENHPSIYNLFTGIVYEISPIEAELLRQLELNHTVDSVITSLNLSSKWVEKTLNKYREACLGDWFSDPVFISKLSPDYSFIENLFFKFPDLISRATISLSNACSSNCFFCDSSQYVSQFRCMTCTGAEKKASERVLPLHIAKNALFRLKQLNCSEILFIIPDFDALPDHFSRIIEYAHSLHFKHIKIHIGNGSLSSQAIQFLSKYDFTICIQKSISTIDELSDFISNITDLNLSFLSQLVLMVDSSLDLAGIRNLLSKLPINIVTQIIPVCHKNDYRAGFDRIELRQFGLSQTYNLCLYGSLYIDSAGDIFPCSGLTDFRVGTVDNWSEIFNSDNKMNLKYFWYLNKEKFDKCKNCGLQYLCSDCRSIEYQLSGSIISKLSCNR